MSNGPGNQRDKRTCSQSPIAGKTVGLRKAARTASQHKVNHRKAFGSIQKIGVFVQKTD